MILHIVPDEKFIPFLQELFEEASPNGSLWRVLTDKKKLNFAVQNASTKIIDGGYFFSNEFRLDLVAVDSVIFHSLILTRLQTFVVLQRIAKSMPIVWRGWGFDYYSYLIKAGNLRLILPQTQALITKTEISNLAYIKTSLGKIIGEMLRITVGKAINNKFVSRVNYFSCCVPEDFEALKEALPNFSAYFLPLNYYSKEDVFLRGENLYDLNGKDILLGNSASATNNHIEAMRMLSELGMSGRKVIVPLNYGDQEYQQKVIRAGEELLGESFFPLTKFLALAEYNQIVSSCSNVMMNHVRQQAIGNVSAALLRGGKVFLRPDNPIYKYYSRLGAKLYPITSEIELSQFDEMLGQDDVIRNKEVMEKVWARETGLEQVRVISKLGYEK